MGKACLFVLCALLAYSPTLARAQSYEGVGIRAQGMAGAFVAVADDATASWWNPAGLATSLSFADLIVEAGQGGHRGIALGFPSLGLSYYRLNISQIQPFGSTGPGGSSRQDLGAVGTGLSVPDSIALDQVGATVGQSIGGHLVVASTLKLTHARSETRAGLDLGAMAAFGPMRVGLTVRDVTAGTFGSGPGAFELARRARAGVALIAPPRGRLNSLTLAFDADLNKAPVDGRDERHIAGGAEAWMLGRRIGVRGGVGMAITEVSNDGGPFGAFGVSVSPFEKVYLDGAMTRGADSVRNRWGIDLRVTF
jgi:hypothetical protein